MVIFPVLWPRSFHTGISSFFAKLDSSFEAPIPRAPPGLVFLGDKLSSSTRSRLDSCGIFLHIFPFLLGSKKPLFPFRALSGFPLDGRRSSDRLRFPILVSGLSSCQPPTAATFSNGRCRPLFFSISFGHLLRMRVFPRAKLPSFLVIRVSETFLDGSLMEFFLSHL